MFRGALFSRCKMQARLKNFNHFLSIHILSQRKCNQFNLLSVLVLYVPMCFCECGCECACECLWRHV